MNNIVSLDDFRKMKQLKHDIEYTGYKVIVAEYESPELVKELKKDLIRLEARLKIANLPKEY